MSFHKSVKGKTPYEAWFGHNPNVSNFGNFGSRAWARIPSENRKDLQPQSKEYIIVGYGDDTKVYNIFETSILNTFIERSVHYKRNRYQILSLHRGNALLSNTLMK